MPDYDGEIKLGVKLTTDDIRKSANDLRASIEKVLNESNGKKLDNTFKSVLSSLDKAYSKSVQLEQELQAMGTRKIPTEQYKSISDSIDNLEGKLQKLSTVSIKLQSGRQTRSTRQRLQEIEEEADKLQTKLQYLYETQQSLETSGKAFTSGLYTDDYDKKAQQLSQVNNQIRLLLGKAGKLTEFSNSIKNVALNIAKLGKSAIHAGLTKLKSKVSEIAKNMTHASVKAQSMTKSFLLAMIGVRSISALFGKLKNAISEGIKNIIEFDKENNELSKSVDNLKANLSFMKNSFGSAFAPLIQVVIPYLNLATQAIGDFMNKVGALFAMLTGKSTFIAAKKQVDEYGNAIKTASGNQKKLNAELYGFDTLNRQQDQSGSGGTDVSDMFEVKDVASVLPDWAQDWINTLKELWENKDFYGIGSHVASLLNDGMQNLDSWIKNQFRPKAVEWVQNISEGFNGLVDGFAWDSLGVTFGDGLNSLIDIVNTFLGPSGFNFQNLGSGIGSSLKSGIDTIKWNDLSMLFANKFNAWVHVVEGIVTTDGLFSSVASAISDSILGFFTNLDYDSIQISIVTIFNELVNIIANIDWLQTFNSLWTALTQLTSRMLEILKNLDWAAIGQFIIRALLDLVLFISNPANIADLVLLLFQGVVSVLNILLQLVIGAISGLAQSIADAFRRVGLDSIAGLLDGISSALRNIGVWLKEHVVDPIVNGVKYLLGIHSPSTVFASIGGFIIEGLKNGITDMWDKIKNSVFDTFDSLKNKVKDIFGIHSPSKVFEDYGKFIDLGFIEGIESEEDNVLKSVADMMAQVANENAELDTSINTDNFNLDSAIAQLSIIADKFKIISDSMLAIANMPIPVIATHGMIPYSANVEQDNFSSKADIFFDRLYNLILNMRNDENSGSIEIHVHADVDGKELYDIIVDENNSQILRSGSSRLKLV